MTGAASHATYTLLLAADVPASDDGVPASSVEVFGVGVDAEGVHSWAIERLFHVPDQERHRDLLLGRVDPTAAARTTSPPASHDAESDVLYLDFRIMRAPRTLRLNLPQSLAALQFACCFRPTWSCFAYWQRVQSKFLTVICTNLVSNRRNHTKSEESVVIFFYAILIETTFPRQLSYQPLSRIF